MRVSSGNKPKPIENEDQTFSGANETITSIGTDFNESIDLKDIKINLKKSDSEINEKIENGNNFIIAELNIKKEDINKDIRIINSYEECLRKVYPNEKLKEEFKNEEEIKQCEIKINEKLIPFNYFHKFAKEGKYIIKYSFKNNLTKTNFMFYGCDKLTNLNLSNFITKNVINMNCMFYKCSSITNIDLSKFNTENVINMNHMFCKCSSLTYLNLSNFNTQKVKYMMSMFFGCSSLAKIDLSKFNTQNVSNMIWIFSGCSSLLKDNVLTKDNKILEEF